MPSDTEGADAVARVLQEDVRVNRLWDLIADNDSVGGKLGTSARNLIRSVCQRAGISP